MNILDPKTGETVVISYDKLKQRQLNLAAIRNKIPKPVQNVDPEFDEDAGRYAPTIIVDRDPGDER